MDTQQNAGNGPEPPGPRDPCHVGSSGRLPDSSYSWVGTIVPGGVPLLRTEPLTKT
ncbi:hypothetical protein GCM10009788_47550 [Nocardioides humi]|uniref:Uncharacterized protein n=1 Tax=Nocardioides humi TaxID=449461 RepID=A0ABN2BEG1_9ACTN